MKPIHHPTNNDVLAAPPGVPIEECQPLYITRAIFEGNQMPAVVSYWAPSAEELALLKSGAAVRITVWGDTHPPFAIGVDGDGVLG